MFNQTYEDEVSLKS